MSRSNRKHHACGIYAIRCVPTGKVYIGSSTSIITRWEEHRRYLRQNKHHSQHLQHAWNKYGEPNFVFEVLEFVEVDRLIECEQCYIDNLGSSDRGKGFNMRPVAESNRGRVTSEATKAKLSVAGKGKKRSEATKAKIAAVKTGLKHSEETKAKLRAYRSGKPLSEEHRAKVSESLKSRIFSEEHRARLSEASRRRYQDPEERTRAAERSRGKRHSLESRAKMTAVTKLQENIRCPLTGRFLRHQSSHRDSAPCKQGLLFELG